MALDVVKRCQSDVMPVVVFATAYDEYAIRAFEANAVDYLLKPFEADRVHSCGYYVRRDRSVICGPCKAGRKRRLRPLRDSKGGTRTAGK